MILPVRRCGRCRLRPTTASVSAAAALIVVAAIPAAMAIPAMSRIVVAAPAEVDHADGSASPAIRATPTYSMAAPSARTAPVTRTPRSSQPISPAGPRKVVNATAMPPRASTVASSVTVRPMPAVVSPGRESSTSRNAAMSMAAPVVVDEEPPASSMPAMSALVSVGALSGTGTVVGAPAAVVPGAASAGTEVPVVVSGADVAGVPPAVNEKLPSIGCESPARTLQRTPISPPLRAGSKLSVNVLASSLTTESGRRNSPSVSSTTKPSPASVDSPVNSSTIWLTGPSTTSPFAGFDPTKSVCAEAGVAPPSSATVHASSTANSNRRSAARREQLAGSDMTLQATTPCEVSARGRTWVHPCPGSQALVFSSRRRCRAVGA